MLNFPAALFDCDGLLLDSEPVLDEVYQLFSIARTGAPIPDEIFKPMKVQLFGRSLEETLSGLCRTIGIAPVDIEEYRRFQDKHALPRFPNVPFQPGAETLVRHLAAHDIPIAVATSAPLYCFEKKIERHRGTFNLFGAIVTGDQVPRCKPEPDIFLEAARRLQVRPEHCLVFEDAPAGVEAAKRAGMTAIAIPPPDADPIFYSEADAIYRSLEHLELERWNLAPVSQ